MKNLISDNDLSILVDSHLPLGEISDILTRFFNIYHDYLVFIAQCGHKFFMKLIPMTDELSL